MNTAQDNVLEYAEKWIGYLEKKSNDQLESMTDNAGDKNYTIFAKWYKDLWGDDLQAQPWCAMFVSIALYNGCGKEIVPHFASCSIGISNFKKSKGGTWITSKPCRGDVIFFADSKGNPAHVGLVSSVSNSRVVTIEGNTSGASGVVPNGGGVCKKSYALTYSRIIGYGRPSYANVYVKPNDVNKKEDDELTQDQFNKMMDTYLATLANKQPESWSADARKWAESNGIIKGDDTGKKEYKNFCTREMMVEFLYRFKGLK